MSVGVFLLAEIRFKEVCCLPHERGGVSLVELKMVTDQLSSP